MQQQLTQSEQSFRNSLRSESSKKPFRTSTQCELNEIKKFLSKLISDLGHDVDAIKVAENLVTGQIRQLKRHLTFFVFIPDPNTYIGERILKEIEIWIIILVVFHTQCNRQNKLDDFVYINIEEHMQKHIKNEQGAQMIQRQVNKALDRLKVNPPKEIKEVSIQHDQPIQELISKEIQCPSSQKEILLDIDDDQIKEPIKEPPQEIKNDQIKEEPQYEPLLKVQITIDEQLNEPPQCIKQETPKRIPQSNLKSQSKVLSRSKLRVQFSDNKENFNYENEVLFSEDKPKKQSEKQWQQIQEEQSIQSEINQLIDQQLQEVEDCASGKKVNKTTFTQRMFSFLHLRSSQKKLCHRDNIIIHNGINYKKLPNQIFANVESMILEDIKGNSQHSIVKLSIDNPPELIENGLYAMIEMKKECCQPKHHEDWIAYQNYVNRINQEYMILIPYNQYKL